MRANMRDFWRDETGMDTVEIILIMVVLIGLVIIFKKQLNDLVKKVFQKINSDSNSIISALPQNLRDPGRTTLS